MEITVKPYGIEVKIGGANLSRYHLESYKDGRILALSVLTGGFTGMSLYAFSGNGDDQIAYYNKMCLVKECLENGVEWTLKQEPIPLP